ncbi:MAG TPA: class I lanthipeptide [Kofleriaceae bacterium]|nr:class I lanthipeptide [Kofleriaceae bacterium]
MSKKRNKKLALKRETLRKLDNNQLQGAAGGIIYKSKYCTGDNTQAGGSGGCTTTDAGAMDPGDFAVNPAAFKAY